VLAKENDATVRVAVLTALGKINAEPAQVVPLLVAGVKDDNERFATPRSMRSPAPARCAARRCLRSPRCSRTATLHLATCGALAGRLGPDAAEALPAMIDAARVSDGAPVFARRSRRSALRHCRRCSRRSRPPIQRAASGFCARCAASVRLLFRRWWETLQARDPGVRVAAAKALADLGSEAGPAEKALFTAASDPDPKVQAAGLRALVALRSESPRLRNAFGSSVD
jgi:HEAT repeat protein